MQHQDSQITNVKRTKNDELKYSVTVKREDYSDEDFEILRLAWQDGNTYDVEVKTAISTINPTTGEITEGSQL